jgi:agmatine deiminase
MRSTRRAALKAAAVAAGWAGMTRSVVSTPSFAASAAPLVVPDERARHTRTFMQWPSNRRVHRHAEDLDALQGAVARIAGAIADFEPVVMLAAGDLHGSIRPRLAKGVELWDVPVDDLWCRDSGPIFAFDAQGKPVTTRIQFNGWGGKQAHEADALVAARVARKLGLPILDHGLVGEAGGLEADGEGTLIAHESSWVNPNRNAGSKAEVERRLLAAMGATKVIWAPGLKDADITDYHIDALARFVAPGVVAIQAPERLRGADKWSLAAARTREALKQARDAKGRPLVLHTLPEPERPRVRHVDFVAAYANYYVCNGAVIAPQFGDRDADREAHRLLAAFYPGREVVALEIDAIGEAGGGIHCATQQQPA